MSRSQITLLQGIGKGDKAERVIRDATQLGAEHIVLVQSERSVPRVKDKQAQRQQRYERVALEAARQCGRGDVPRVTGPVPWLVALAQAKASDFRLAFDAQAELLLKSALVGAQGRAVAALVGPEGGLTETERESACQEGFSLVRLGAFVLRTETAAVAALAAIAEHL